MSPGSAMSLSLPSAVVFGSSEPEGWKSDLVETL